MILRNALFQKFLTGFIAWILLLGGLFIIFWALYSSYNIFTAKVSAPQIFKIEKEILAPPTKGKTPTTQAELQEEMEKMVAEQLKELIPTETLTTLLNLIARSIFAGILIFAGSQIGSLGIKLMRK